MATSSLACISHILNVPAYKSQILQLAASAQTNGSPYCLFVDRRNLQRPERRRKYRGSKTDFVIRNATPEAAGDIVSSFSFPGFPGLSLPDNPWITGIAGLAVTLPFIIQWLLTLTKEVDMAAETVEKIADAVGKVAEEVDKAAEEMAEALPEGGLKKVVSFVEDLAEETAKDAQKVEELMDKVEELDDKLEGYLKKQSKDSDKA